MTFGGGSLLLLRRGTAIVLRAFGASLPAITVRLAVTRVAAPALLEELESLVENRGVAGEGVGSALVDSSIPVGIDDATSEEALSLVVVLDMAFELDGVLVVTGEL